MTNNTDQVRALADELQQAAAGEDIPSAAAAYADCAGRLRTLAVLRAARDSVPAEQLLDYCAAVAAVAELIEALSNLCSGLPHLHADLVAVLGASNAHEVMRLRTALARCRGEA